MTRIAPALVSTEWLAGRLSAPDIKVVDASWHLPQAERDAKREYATAHIPGAVFFDIDEVADDTTGLPHMLPQPPKFASRARRLGLGDGMHFVVYDSVGLYSAARAWWMFRAMGHREVSVLDGGLPKWRREGRPLEDMAPMRRERHFTPRPNRMILRDRTDLQAALAKRSEQIVDARSAARFTAAEPEPRPGVRGGRIPGSLNLPYTELLAEDGTMKDEAGLRAAFAAAGVDLNRPVVATCGSGVTAPLVLLALAQLGTFDAALYDGSWAEWGADPELPVEA